MLASLSVWELAYCAFVLTLTYAIRGTTGFGGINAPLLALVLPVTVIAPVITFLGFISSAIILAKDHRHASRQALVGVMPYCAVGVALGLYFFKTLDARALTKGLGVMVILYGLFSMWVSFRPPVAPKRPSAGLNCLMGAGGGFVGTMFGSMAGVFFAIYVHVLKLDKAAFRATCAALLTVLGVMRGAGYVAIGAFGPDTLALCLAALPVAALGMWIGNFIHHSVSPVAFTRVVAGLFIVSGMPLLVKG